MNIGSRGEANAEGMVEEKGGRGDVGWTYREAIGMRWKIETKGLLFTRKGIPYSSKVRRK